MNQIILETENLTKQYKNTLVLDRMNLSIEKGKIYGFIGQNGAGKTTLIRLITGLSFKTSGKIFLFGKSSEKELQKQRSRIGCMVEQPALYPNLSAMQNLEVQRIQQGIPDKSVVKECLNVCGLMETTKKPVRNFSLGMRQRLGIAAALLNTPEFLILDEPVNGLDPSGIVEIRNLLKKLNQTYGMTILLSSHILEELYQTASRFILIDKGKILEELSERELNVRCKRYISIKTTDTEAAILKLQETFQTENMQVMPDGSIRLYDDLEESQRIAEVMADAHILVTQLSIAGDTLEDYFIHKIRGIRHD